jgi:hypothetical protein
MVGVMHQNGINVIQDIVLNHIDGAGSATSAGGVDSAGISFYNTNRPSSNYQDIPNDPTSGYKNFRYVSFLTPATTETRANYLARSGRWPKNWQNFNPGPGDNRYTGDDLSRIMFGARCGLLSEFIRTKLNFHFQSGSNRKLHAESGPGMDDLVQKTNGCRWLPAGCH